MAMVRMNGSYQLGCVTVGSEKECHGHDMEISTEKRRHRIVNSCQEGEVE